MSRPAKVTKISALLLVVLASLTLADVAGAALLWINMYWLAGAGGALAVSLCSMPPKDSLTRHVHEAMSFGFALYLCGQVVWAIQVATGWAVVPGPSDVLFLLAPLPMIWGTLSFVHRVSRPAAKTAWLDALTVSLAILCLTLATFGAGAVNLATLQAVTLLAYPVLYLAPVGAILVSVLAVGGAHHASGTWLMLVGALVLGTSFSIWTATALVGQPSVGTFVDFLFGVGLLVAARGSTSWTSVSTPSNRMLQNMQKLSELVPVGAILVAVAVALIVNPPHPVSTLTGITIVAMLLINSLRQVLRIQEQRRQQNSLKAEISARELAEYNSRTCFDLSPVPLCLVGFEDASVVEGNAAFSELIGKPRDELIAANVRITDLLFPCAEGPKLDDQLRQYSIVANADANFVTNRSPLRIECRYSTAIVHHGSELVWQVAVHDLTALRDSERAQAKLEGRLQRFDAVSSIGTLTSGIAHDFRNVLAVVVGYSELALADETISVRLRDNLREILAAGKRADELTAQLLAFNRTSDDQRGTIDLISLVNETAKFLRATLPTRYVITIETNLDVALAVGQATLAQQILLNLGVNAASAMSDGGRLAFRLRREAVTQPRAVRGGSLDRGDYVVVCIEDSGAGMAPEVQDQAFEPYFTTKSTGTGLGLATAKETIESFGGAIDFQSVPHRGTTFEVYWPTIDTLREPESAILSPIALGDGQRILIVDDNRSIASLHAKVLDSAGYRTSTQVDSRQALAEFAAEPSSFDMLLTDFDMPVINGCELADQITRIRTEIPVLLLTGNPPGQLELSAPFGRIMTKPVSAPELLDAVAALLALPSAQHPLAKS